MQPDLPIRFGIRGGETAKFHARLPGILTPFKVPF
jgi:hypothetical protein